MPKGIITRNAVYLGKLSRIGGVFSIPPSFKKLLLCKTFDFGVCGLISQRRIYKCNFSIVTVYTKKLLCKYRYRYRSKLQNLR